MGDMDDNIEDEIGPSVFIDRPALTRTAFRKVYDIQDVPSTPLKARIKKYMQTKCQCSTSRLKQEILQKVPCIKVLQTYQWKQWLTSDIIAGLSVGVMHIPQGMGFSLLTNLPAVYGLYASIIPLWIYFIFGTSRHLSVGPMALTSLMIGAVVTKETALWSLSRPNVTVGNWTEIDPHLSDVKLIEFKLGIATSVTLLMGVCQLIMWLLHLNILATYMSMSFISAFMTGAAVHIITSQVPSLFGIKVCSCPGTVGLPKKIVDICAHLPDTNAATFITGAICIAVLLILKEVVSDRVKKYIKVPVPAELLVVIFATLISYLGKLEYIFGVKSVGHIPTGIPKPHLPTMVNASSYIVDSAIVGIVGFAINVSMAKLISKRRVYEIDTNQEMMAYGLQNAIGSLLHCFGGAQAPPRTLVCEATGGQTQLAGLISTILPLIVCLVAGPLFEPLPKCVLAAIIIVALLPLLKTVMELPRMWRVNKIDFVVYVITILSTVILSVVAGLAIGIIMSIFLVVVRMQLAKLHEVLAPQDTEVYIPKSEHNKPSTTNKVMVFRFDADLFFANVETFKAALFKKTASPMEISKSSAMLIKRAKDIKMEHIKVTTAVDNAENELVDDAIDAFTTIVEIKESTTDKIKNSPKPEKEEEDIFFGLDQLFTEASNSRCNNGEDNKDVSDANLPKEQDTESTSTAEEEYLEKSFTAIVLDCSAISYIDIMGLNTLLQIKNEYDKVYVTFALACCREPLIEKLLLSGLMSPDKIATKDRDKDILVFPTVQDAVQILGSPKLKSRDSKKYFRF